MGHFTGKGGKISNNKCSHPISKGPFIYYVITFLEFLHPPPPLRKHDFTTENNQKLAFSDPAPPLQVIT